VAAVVGWAIGDDVWRFLANSRQHCRLVFPAIAGLAGRYSYLACPSVSAIDSDGGAGGLLGVGSVVSSVWFTALFAGAGGAGGGVDIDYRWAHYTSVYA